MDETPVDVTVVHKILGSSDPEMVNMVLDVFLSSYQGLAQRIDHALAARDASELREAAHSAAGAAANIGAVSLTERLRALELQAVDADWDAATITWTEAGGLGERAVEFIKAR